MIHTIAPGETLARIATRYGVSVQTIAAANGIADPNRIAAGRVLTIPGATINVRPVVRAGAVPGMVPVVPVAVPVQSVAPASGSWLSTLLTNVPSVAQTYADTKRAVALNKLEIERLRANPNTPFSTPGAPLQAAEASPSGGISLPVLLIVGAAGLALFFNSKPKTGR